MRGVVTVALTLLVLLAVPAGALGAKPAPPWPSAQDVRSYEPALRPADASCIARYYDHRLSRKAWFTPYYELTAADKITTDEGQVHCMTLAERIATDERTYAGLAGELPQMHCAAVRAEALPRARRLQETSYATWLRDYDGIFRGCRLIGALYAGVAKGLHLPLPAAEQACANRVGSGDPLLDGPAMATTKASLTVIGGVLDRCSGSASEQAMYRYIYRNYRFPSKIPCIARRVAEVVGFGDLLKREPRAKAAAGRAVAACLAGS